MKIIKKLLSIIACFLVFMLTAIEKIISQHPVTITTMAVPPVSNYINQALSGVGNGVHVILRNDTLAPITFKLWATIEKLPPSPIKIDINPVASFNAIPTITLMPKIPMMLDNNVLKQAFANFSQSDLIITPSSAIDSIREGLNFKLPEGQYKLCIYAREVVNNQLTRDVANPQLGCTIINICKLSAPQFIQPVNNLNINSTVTRVDATSPFVFTWLPPQASCGVPFNALSYNFEIKEILDNQTITDAVNNPFVFRKTALRASTFLLDTNLYRNVLRAGRRYIMRVQAEISGSNAPLAIENNGYSRVEAFQYGGYNTEFESLPEPSSYLISSTERKTDFWDDVYTEYEAHKRGDTLIPLKEYIALVLTEHGIAYNVDAIELFLALNPDLANEKQVKLSHTSKLPDYPLVATADQNKFSKEYETNLEPDSNEANRFRRYFDSLRATSLVQGVSANVTQVINDFLPKLNSFSQQVYHINRVSVGLVNMHLSELLFIINSKSLGNIDYKRMQGIVSGVLDLIAQSVGSGSMYSLQNLRSLTAYYNPIKNISNKGYLGSYANIPVWSNNINGNYYIPPLQKPLIRFDVVIWRYSRESPGRIVSDAPDLNRTYRIFYTTPVLYNAKNPEGNAKSSADLASVATVALPNNSAYILWGLNMLNHQLTKPQKIEISDAFLLANKKDWTNGKNYRIIIKAY